MNKIIGVINFCLKSKWSLPISLMSDITAHKQHVSGVVSKPWMHRKIIGGDSQTLMPGLHPGIF